MTSVMRRGLLGWGSLLKRIRKMSKKINISCKVIPSINSLTNKIKTLEARMLAIAKLTDPEVEEKPSTITTINNIARGRILIDA